MSLIKEIIDWGKKLPYWQQVVIAKILEGVTFNEVEMAAIIKLAKEKSSVGAKSPLDEYCDSDANSTGQEDDGAIVLLSIDNVQDINNLKNGCGIKFGERGLSVIYGENGTGKSGYTRILKACCNCRDKAHLVLGNVFRGSGVKQSAAIKYRLKDEKDYVWEQGGGELSSDLQRVHVFDSISADTYLRGDSDIEYRPSGMDILDKLVVIVGKVKVALESERQGLEFNEYSWKTKYLDTEAAFFLNHLGDEKAISELEKLCTFDAKEKKMLEELPDDIRQRERLSPSAQREVLQGKNNALKDVKAYLEQLNSICTKDVVVTLNKHITDYAVAKEAAEKIKVSSFDNDEYLDGTGNDAWKELWKIAVDYAKRYAYPEADYPSSKAKKCVLCQQDLDDESMARMKNFSEYASDKSQKMLDKKNELLDKCITKAKAVLKDEDDEENLLSKIREPYGGIYDDAKLKLRIMRKAIGEIIVCLEKRIEIASVDGLGAIAETIANIDNLISANEEGLDKPLDDTVYNEKIKNDKHLLLELQARERVVDCRSQLEDDINAYKRKKLLDDSISSCDTTTISKELGVLSDKYIIRSLATNFDEEIKRLSSGKIRAALVKSSTRKGTPYSAIRLSSDKGILSSKIALGDVLSEGEYRGASIAGFIAELKTFGDNSAVVFDDPVTSLDHKYSQRIAERLCELAKSRQVIVFTHNILFLSQLMGVSKKEGVPNAVQTVRAGNDCFGLVSDGLPIEKMTTTKRVKALKNCIQAELTPDYENDSEMYKSKVEMFYRDLRGAWERFVEEVLFNGVVTRLDYGIHTQKLRKVDICELDIVLVNENMSKCSIYMHDQPSDVVVETPVPNELLSDVGVLEQLIKNIRSRRGD